MSAPFATSSMPLLSITSGLISISCPFSRADPETVFSSSVRAAEVALSSWKAMPNDKPSSSYGSFLILNEDAYVIRTRVFPTFVFSL